MLPLGWGVGVPRVDEARVDEPRLDRNECITLLISSLAIAELSSSAARDLGQPLRKAFD
jgi:hypothetical protein